jgi:hypothetical protein
MVNADSDERLPRECIERLYAAAHEPREMIWRPGLHVQPNRTRVVQDLVDIVLARVNGTDHATGAPQDAPTSPATSQR